jgi:hypothetical protein
MRFLSQTAHCGPTSSGPSYRDEISTPVKGTMNLWSWKFKNMSPTSPSAIHDSPSSALTNESMVGARTREPRRTHSACWLLHCKTIRISSSPFGNAKYFISDLTLIPVVRRYLLLTTLLILSFTLAWIPASAMTGWASLDVGPGRSNQAGIPSCTLALYRSGKRKCTNLEPAWNSNQFV